MAYVGLNTEGFSKEFIFKHLSQEEIWQYYVNLSTGQTITTESNILSPVREESVPSFRLFYRNGVLKGTDFGGSFKSGDCIDLVKFLYGLSYKQAVGKIISDLILDKKIDVDITKATLDKNKNKSSITYNPRSWNVRDDKYWTFLTRNFLDSNLVEAASAVFLNNSVFSRNGRFDPCYVFTHDRNHIKVYFPERDRPRFISNTGKFYGLHNLLPADIIIITKSDKDCVYWKFFGYQSIAPPSESYILNEEQYEYLKERYKYIIINYDYDEQGLFTAMKIKQLYAAENRVKLLFFTDGPKDLYDIIRSRVLIESEFKALQYMRNLLKRKIENAITNG